MTGAFVCLTLCLGRKGQNLEPLGPAVPSPHGGCLMLIGPDLGPKGKLEKLLCKAI